MKRYTETNKWKDQWFSMFDPVTKSVLQYLWDNCDHAGVWQPNYQTAEFEIGWHRGSSALAKKGALTCRALHLCFPKVVMPDSESPTILNWKAIFDIINQPLPDELTFTEQDRNVPQIVILPTGRVWLVKFCKFQYQDRDGNFALYANSSIHVPVFRSLHKNNLLKSLYDYFPGVMTEEMVNKPPLGLEVKPSLDSANRARAAVAFVRPSLEAVLTWPERFYDGEKELPRDQIELFVAHYDSSDWKVRNERKEPHALLTKWAIRYRQSLQPTVATAPETPGQLKLRIEQCDKDIIALQQKQWQPAGKTRLEITPDAKQEIARIKQLREGYEKKMREGPTTNESEVGSNS